MAYARAIKSVNGKVTPILGVLRVAFEIDGLSKILSVKAVNELDHDLVLGMDFCRDFDVTAQLAKGMWRAEDNEWRPFTEKVVESQIFAECVGIVEVASEQRKIIGELVERLLPREGKDHGVTNLIEHHINVQNAEPVTHKFRRMSPKMLEMALAEVDKLRVQNIIEPSVSDWRSAPVIVKKPDGSWRFCIDFRDVNRVTKKDAYMIPNMDAILDRLRNAK